MIRAPVLCSEEELFDGDSVPDLDFRLSFQEVRGVEAQLEERAVQWSVNSRPGVRAEYLVEDLEHVVGQSVGCGDVRYGGDGILRKLPDSLRTSREIVRDKDTVPVIDEITGPISRDEASNLPSVQLMHA